ncbi:MAG: toast rack family protein [Candidatus Berkelbacteria bacterium]|nr:toast rack family protein [Candidatus Berkelbacteria bacterium]
MSLGKLLWGVIIVAIGLIFLAVNFGLLDSSVWSQIFKLWPLIIVVIGISIISGALSKVWQIILSIIAALIVIAAVALVVSPISIVSTSSSDWSWGFGGTHEVKVQTISEPLNEAAERASIEVQTGAADLDLSGGSQILVDGRVESNFINSQVERKVDGKIDNIVISTKSYFNPIFGGKNVWQLSLNEILPMKLVLKTGAVDAKIDLKKTNIEELVIKSGASTYEVDFPVRPNLVRADIDLGASTIKIKVPKDVGLKIEAKTGASSNNFSSKGLTKTNDTYSTQDFEKALKKIEINLKTGASTIELERY